VESAMTGASAFTASVSNPSSTSPVASVSLTATPTAGSYSLNVTSPGVYASAMGADGLTRISNPDSGSISDASIFTLTVGADHYTIRPGGNKLSDLERALNASGAVDATLVNIGSAGSPDYRLSLEGTKLGNLPIQLTTVDGANPDRTLLTPQTPPGAAAQYQLNGQPATPIQSETSTVTISPGVSVKLLGTGTATVTVSPSTGALSSALAGLANAYNTAMADINKNRGQTGGALAGQSLLMDLSAVLKNMVGYTAGSSAVSSLTSLGFSFDQKGVLSFNGSVFSSAVSNRNAQLESFLGSSKTGGFLKAASDALDGMLNSTSGVLTQDLKSFTAQIAHKLTAIADEQNKINKLQMNLNRQMAAADAAIASLEQQYNQMNYYYQAMQMQALQNG
jgi:flagellar hook-associated protein 2